ncbi:5'/3'-nucleotidase SurE [Kitasatospora azatica]|uniref:5'/3'-nucleotidase SurE n=1 Tax=Kitasatospora azatica TaxID=58347 RepID=UPI000564AFCA|nr:5'/3'-nucleotidase SurE [Kitasatospora azatica]
MVSHGLTRVLVTNDDGIDSPGLRHLALAARRIAEQVVVAAPAQESSGSSAALGAVEEHGRIPVEDRRLTGLDDVPAHAVQALPGFIALIAGQGAFGSPPDLLLSGINRGANTGRAVLHSGTVGAALTAVHDGCRALAVSLDLGSPPHWSAAEEVTAWILPLLLSAPAGTLFNLNVPNRPLDQLKGVRGAELAPFGTVQTTVTERGRGFVRVSLSENGPTADPGAEPRTDADLLAHGYASLSVLTAVSGAPGGPELRAALAGLGRS